MTGGPRFGWERSNAMRQRVSRALKKGDLLETSSALVSEMIAGPAPAGVGIVCGPG